jgi:hypothetical protein
MPSERWGAFSVVDHIDEGALAADVLLYDSHGRDRRHCEDRSGLIADKPGMLGRFFPSNETNGSRPGCSPNHL